MRQFVVRQNGYKVERSCFIVFFFLWGVFFASSLLMALHPQKAITQYKQDTWQTERGLMQKSIITIRQSHDGYIWLGTMNGLVRFDGSRFKTFNKENTRHLKDNIISKLLVDRKGVLWIGTSKGGLSFFKDEKFRNYSLDEYPFLEYITAIYEDRGGAMWFGTMNSGMTRLKNGEFVTYTTRNGLAGDRVRAFYEDEHSLLWIATSGGLSIRSPSGKISGYAGRNGCFKKYIISMCATKNGVIWIGCMDGLHRLKNDEFTHFGKKDGLLDLRITWLYEDSDQNIWVGTDGGGLARVRDRKIETFPRGEGLASDFIFSIFEDKGKNLWIGSSKEGLHRLRDTDFVFYTSREGLSHDAVNSIDEGRDGSIWIGTKNGVNRLKKERLALELTRNEGLSSDVVTAVLEDSAGYLWVGTEAGLVRCKDSRPKHFNNYSDVIHDDIFQLWEDKRGTIWILTQKNLIRFRDEIFTVLFSNKKMDNHPNMCFYLDQQGCGWIGTYGIGLFRLKGREITAITTKEGLVHNEVQCFYEDEQGILYIGTRGGLSLLDKGKFTNINTEDGLIESYIYQIVEDDFGCLWMAGRKGISCINKKVLLDFAAGYIEKVNPTLFNESDGVKNSVCDQCLKTRDGRLWFATDEGVAVIDPANIKKNDQPPPVVIEELIGDGKSYNIHHLRTQKRGDAILTLPPGIKRLEFYYTALSFIESGKIKFKQKLAGYDSELIDRGHSRNIDYTGLKPGEYTFYVKACNSDSVWNEKGASLSFYIKPYFYQTTWFFILAGIFVLFSVFSFYRFRVRQLKAREKELSVLVDVRTKEIGEKNIQLEEQTTQLKEQSEKLKEMDTMKSRFFANISHEFRTPLTLILGPLEQMIEACPGNEAERKRKLTLVFRNAQRLLRLINQLLELSKLDSGRMKLQACETDIITFIKGIVDSFRVLTQQKELELVFAAGEGDKENGEALNLYIDPRKMEDIMSNLLVNAVKFTPPGGEVRVSVKQHPPGFVEISVDDTGPGIPREQLDFVFDRFYQADSTFEFHEKGSGIGLALCKELAELHHGVIEAENREEGGSRFVVRLPMGRERLTDEEIVQANEINENKQKFFGGNFPRSKVENWDRRTASSALGAVFQKSPPGRRRQEENFIIEKEKEIILVVEDSAEMRDYIRGELEPAYTVIEAEDGRRGIEKARETVPDLIISDVMMPEIDGYELCRTLKTGLETSHIPVILLTAKASEENVVAGLETGADDYVTKPFKTKILLARIKNLIDIRAQLQKNINREMTLQPAKTSVSTLDREFLEDLNEAIKKNLADEDFNVEKLAKKLYMGRTSLYRKVLALTGLTPTEFIRSYRLMRGAELLKKGSIPVLEVAFEVGFSDSSYFSKCFKEKFHQLPSEFQTADK